MDARVSAGSPLYLLERSDVGHLALPIDGRVVRWVVDALVRSDRRRRSRRDGPPAFDVVANPAS